jgi:hypothetical protein
MDTPLDPKQTDPRHVLLDRADQELAHAYEQITRADEDIARAEEQLSKLERDAARTAGRRRRSSFGGQAVRGFTGLVLAACILVAAFVSQSSYGSTAKTIVARWAPRLVAAAGLPAQPSLPAVPAAEAKTAPPQPALAQTAPQDVVPTAAALSPELTQLLQSMARDLATLGQGIEQLKAGQEQMARDNATAAEQIKASQEQMARLMAKASEAKASEARASLQNLRPTTPVPPPRPTATPTRKPVPSSQAATRPR